MNQEVISHEISYEIRVFDDILHMVYKRGFIKKRIKKLLLLLIAAIMLVHCVGIIGFAGEDSKSVPVLVYHHFTNDIDDGMLAVTPQNFEAHIKAMSAAGYTGVSFEQLVDYVENGVPLPEKPVVITIDDGYLSGFEIAYPILEKYNMKATMFIIGVSVGKDIYKETDIPIIPRFSYSQAREMADSGLISIQSHSHDMHQHQPFEILPARRGVLPFEWESEKTYMENFRADYMRSKTEIETHVGTSPVAFAYPFGAHNDLTETMLKEMGVKATLTTKNGVNKVAKGQPESLFALKRIAVSNEMTPDEVISLIEGSNSYPPVETDSAPPVGFHSPPPVTPTPPAVPEPHVAFELTFPETGAINVTGRNITINVTNDNKLAVIKAPLSDGQKLSASRTGVYINVDEMDPEKPVYITVDTRNLTNGGRIEFLASISQSGKSDIVYTIRINNNLAQ